MLDSEQELNALDAANADGDLGRNMARAAQCLGRIKPRKPMGKLHDDVVCDGGRVLKLPWFPKKGGVNLSIQVGALYTYYNKIPMNQRWDDHSIPNIDMFDRPDRTLLDI